MRAFIALSIPEDVKAYLSDVADALSRREDGVRWVRGENQHLTLKFLGEIDEEQKRKIVPLLNCVAERFSEIRVSLKGIDGFPKKQVARVIVITLTDGVEELKNLSGAIEDELAKIGFEKENREFVPHITLGRRKNPKPIKDTFPIEPLQFVMDEIVLYKSILTPSGSIYEPIWKTRLKKGVFRDGKG